MSFKDNITYPLFDIDNFDGLLIEFYTFFYVWLTCIDTSVFGF